MDGALISYKPSRDQAGALDNPQRVLGSNGQVRNAVNNFAVAPWNRFDILERIMAEHGAHVAAIVMEPVLCNSGCILPAAGYLAQVRDLCRSYGALLMFDEVITGFRMSLSGAQGIYNVTPDLATFGKAVGGGAPLSGLAGRAEIVMGMFDGGVSFGGSFNGNPVSLACAHATLTELAQDNAAALPRANELGEGLMASIRELARKHGVPMVVSGFGAAFAVHFTRKAELLDYRDTLDDDPRTLQRFLYGALCNGLHIVPDGRFYVSAAHTASDIDETFARLDRVLGELA